LKFKNCSGEGELSKQRQANLSWKWMDERPWRGADRECDLRLAQGSPALCREQMQRLETRDEPGVDENVSLCGPTQLRSQPRAVYLMHLSIPKVGQLTYTAKSCPWLPTRSKISSVVLFYW
jgi:hypothetical protein